MATALGIVHPVRVTTKPLFSPRGKLIGYVGDNGQLFTRNMSPSQAEVDNPTRAGRSRFTHALGTHESKAHAARVEAARRG